MQTIKTLATAALTVAVSVSTLTNAHALTMPHDNYRPCIGIRCAFELPACFGPLADFSRHPWCSLVNVISPIGI